MTEAQEPRFELTVKTVGLFAGPVLALLLWLTPFQSLSPAAHKLACVFACVVVYWVAEALPLPVTALMIPLLCVLLRVADAKKAFAPFADPIIFLFIGSFVLAAAMFRHGLDRRFAVAILSSRWVGRSPARLLFIFGAATFFLSMWISNTATTALMFPVGLSLLRGMAPARRDFTRLRYSIALMLMASYASSLGGLATKVGTPPNLIGARMIEEHIHVSIPFFQWMLLAFPLAFLMFLLMWAYLSWRCPADADIVVHAFRPASGERGVGRLTAGERNVLIAALVTMLLWIVPGALAIVWGADDPRCKTLSAVLPESVAALVGLALLFVLPTDWKRREFTLTWDDAVKIDWGTIFLFGGGLTLGDLMFSTGLAEAIGNGLVSLTHAESMLGITFLFTLLAAAVSETTSNTASANMLVPIAIAVAKAARVNPLLPALGACLGSSMGFMLPVSTPPNAIVYGSGCIPIATMVRYGLLLDVIGVLVIFFGVVALGSLVLG